MTDNKYQIISTESGDYTTTVNRTYKARKAWTPVNPKHVLSFMPGSVVEFKVKVGDTVKKGQSIILFKAMKMNNNILAPLDGKVKSINVALGENIPKNTVMLEFE